MSPSLSLKKATQALNFFARQQGGAINRLKALKLIFFADRYHLRKYGRPVVGAHYYAMKNGPVASEAKQVAELDEHWLSPRDCRYAERFLRKTSPYFFKSVAHPDEEVFSKSDLEALHFACQQFGNLSQFELSDLTHHYPEWKRHERVLEQGRKRAAMDYRDFFKDPRPKFNPCHPLTDNERGVALELFLDHQTFAQRWS